MRNWKGLKQENNRGNKKTKIKKTEIKHFLMAAIFRRKINESFPLFKLKKIGKKKKKNHLM